MLNLVDAVWTPEERDALCNHEKGDGEAQELFQIIAKRCKLAVHVIKKLREYDSKKNPSKIPSASEPPRQAKAQVLGLANALGMFPIEKFIPNWGVRSAQGIYPRESRTTLMEYVFQEKERLQGLVDNRRMLVEEWNDAQGPNVV
mgnify:CR=1 FL=1